MITSTKPVPSTPSLSAEQQPQSRSLMQRVHHRMSMLLEDGKQKNTIAVLDGVRAIACLCVLVFHLNFFARETKVWYPIHDLGSVVGSIALAGQSGVTLFFVLSGFLLFMPYAKSLLFHTAWPSACLFYMRRAFRIIPAYYVTLLLMIVLFHQEYLKPQHWKEVGLFLTFFMDAPATFQKIDGPFWTLAVEAQFYMLLPLLAFGIGLIVRHGSKVWRTISVIVCLSGMVAWGLLSRYWGHYLAWNPTHTILSLPRSFIDAALPFVYGTQGKYLEDFAIGMLISCAYIYAQNTPLDNRWNRFMRDVSPTLFGVGLLELFVMALWHFNIWYYHYVLHFLDSLLNYYDEYNEICLAVGFGLCVLAILFGHSLLKRPFEWSPLRWMGLISYSLYMWHVPLLGFFSYDYIAHLQGWRRMAEYGLFCAWALLVIIPISLLSYVLVEKPFIRLGEKLRRAPEKRKQKLRQPVRPVSPVEVDKVAVGK